MVAMSDVSWSVYTPRNKYGSIGGSMLQCVGIGNMRQFACLRGSWCVAYLRCYDLSTIKIAIVITVAHLQHSHVNGEA